LKKFHSILITGASSGIGEALADKLAGPGIYLAISGRNGARLSIVAERCRTKGATVLESVIDVSDKVAMKNWIEKVDTDHPLDLIIANAGVSPGTSGEIESAAQARRMMEINVMGVFNTIDPIIPRMRARGTGTIALMSSLAGFKGMPSAPGYGASKAWVRSFGQGLRGNLFSDGVGVSVVCPGFVASRITDQNNFPMPLFMDAPKAASIVHNGLAKNKARIAFPFPMYAMVWLLSVLPLWLTDSILRRLPKKE
jgi:short-subunit dehydrogenase